MTTAVAALEAAEQLARQAGARILEHRAAAALGVERKGRRELVTAADRLAERIVVEGLRARFPDHALFAEEGVLTPRGRADRDAEWLWHIDPIDGTQNYVRGIPMYCVALSLSHRGSLVAAVVHAPALGETFTALRGGGARCNGAPIAVSTVAELSEAIITTGFSYRRGEPGYDDNLARVARVLPACRDLRRLGSAQLDLCYTAAGVVDAYWELHLQPYDLAAGALIVREAGGRVTDLEGGDAWLSVGHVLASNGLLHAPMLALVGDSRG